VPVNNNNCVSYITNHVLISRHYCVFDKCVSLLNLPKWLAHCQIVPAIVQCILTENFLGTPCSVQDKSHHGAWIPECDLHCVKNGPASLKSQRVNKLGYLLATKTQ